VLDGGLRILASFIFDLQMRLCGKAYTASASVSRDGKTREFMLSCFAKPSARPRGMVASVLRRCLTVRTSFSMSAPGQKPALHSVRSEIRRRKAAMRIGLLDALRFDQGPPMSALCQKRTFGPLLDIIVSGQGCSSSWGITRETSPSPISASGSRRYAARDCLAHCNGANVSVAAGAVDCWIRARRRI
jgi:hypothetical protein